MPSPRSAANPASHPSLPGRASPPDCSGVAVSRLVTGLSRASCRDASGLAVLMSTGRRAGLSGLSRPAAPAPPVARPGSCASPARAPRSTSSPTASCSGGLPGIANPGGWASQGTSHARGEWKAARQVGTGLPGRMPGLFPGRGQRAACGLQLCSCGEAAKGAWALDPLQDCPRPPGCGCLPVISTPCPAGHGCITGTRPSC